MMKNKHFEIIKVEKDLDVYGIKYDVPTFKLLKNNLSREDSFELDIAILRGTEDEFWYKRWRKFFHTMEYNAFYKIFDQGGNHYRKKAFYKYFHENFQFISHKFNNEYFLPKSTFYYNKELDDYLQLTEEPGNRFILLQYRMRSLEEAVLRVKTKAKNWRKMFNL